ncbi:MAG TPA: flavin reductase family protein [Anaerolineae bacterium]|nr:flavin reductase family protein [Anaerolineae bacterium]
MSNDPIKDALSRMPYGFYAITSRNGEDVNAMVANWVMQASFSPRLIAVALQKKAYSHSVISEGGVFAVNIFNKGDQEAMMAFTKGRAKNPDKMKEADYTPAPETGSPVLAGAAAYVECRLVELIDVGGDHDILTGEVVGGAILKPGDVSDTLTLPDIGWSYAG